MITIGPGVGFLLLVVGFVVTGFFVCFRVVVFVFSVVVFIVVDVVVSELNHCENENAIRQMIARPGRNELMSYPGQIQSPIGLEAFPNRQLCCPLSIQ